MSILAMTTGPRRDPPIAVATVYLALFVFVPVLAARGQTRTETLERPGGERVLGRLTGDAQAGFAFVPSQGAPPFGLEPGSVLHLSGTGPDSLARTRLFAFWWGNPLVSRDRSGESVKPAFCSA